jgi:hypothetical protein
MSADPTETIKAKQGSEELADPRDLLGHYGWISASLHCVPARRGMPLRRDPGSGSVWIRPGAAGVPACG